MIDLVAENITLRRMLAPGDRVGVAVSGGADSVVLLHVLHRLSSVFQVHLHVLHVNHHLRGPESDEDEAFVRKLAEDLRLPISVGDGRPGAGNLEQEARQARRNFFQVSRQEHNLARIALGHTRSDQAETVLYRLFRGSGLSGLAGMRMVTDDGYIRPLLTVLRNELREWASAEGIRWREDSTNAQVDFARNRLRNELIPAIKEHFNTNLEPVLAGMAQVAQDEEDYWSQQVEPLLAQIVQRTRRGLILAVPKFSALLPAVKRRLIRTCISEVKGDLRGLDLIHFDRIIELCRRTDGHDRVLVPGVDAVRSFDCLLLRAAGGPPEERNYQCQLVPGQECELPFGAGSISVDWVKPDPPFCVKFNEEQEPDREIAYLDGEAFVEGGSQIPLRVRNWQPGDQFHRQRHVKADKIKSLFQEHRVVLWERRHWPVVEAADQIVWVRGFGVSARAAISDQSRSFLRLIYRPADLFMMSEACK